MQTALMAQVTNEGNQLQFYDPANSISPLLPTCLRASLHQKTTITCPLFRVTEAWKVIMWVASPLGGVKRQFLISGPALPPSSTTQGQLENQPSEIFGGKFDHRENIFIFCETVRQMEIATVVLTKKKWIFLKVGICPTLTCF